MKVESYSFGAIIIDGKKYRSDVIIYPDKIDASWWRKEGHALYVEDLKAALELCPDVIVVGTGYYGVMKIPRKTEEFITSRGIQLIAQRTEEAYKIFNELSSSDKKVIGAFHLTC